MNWAKRAQPFLFTSPIAVTGAESDSRAPLRESGRRPEDCRTPEAGAIADTMHVRANVTERGVYAASPFDNPPRLRQFFNERMLKRHKCRGPGRRSLGRIFLSFIFLSLEFPAAD
jgi:hypothetical protein